MTHYAASSGTGVAYARDEVVQASSSSTGSAFSREVLVAMRDSPPLWLDECLRQIEHLRELRSNWDSYGALSIDPVSIELAKDIVTQLGLVDTVERPLVTATAAGHVAFSWDDGDRTLDIEVLPFGTIDYSYLNETQETLDEEGQTSDISKLAVLLTQF